MREARDSLVRIEKYLSTQPAEYCGNMDNHFSAELASIEAALSQQPESGPVVPNEQGTNRYGLDMSYFRKLINRELNRPLTDFRPDEFARVCARMAAAADRSVLQESEFGRKQPSAQVPDDLLATITPEIVDWVYCGMVTNGRHKEQWAIDIYQRFRRAIKKALAAAPSIAEKQEGGDG